MGSHKDVAKHEPLLSYTAKKISNFSRALSKNCSLGYINGVLYDVHVQNDEGKAKEYKEGGLFVGKMKWSIMLPKSWIRLKCQRLSGL